MLKKMLAMLLALVMALSLVACGGGKTEEPAKTDAPAKTEEPAKQPEKEEDPYEYPANGVLTSVIAYSAGGTSDNIVRQVSVMMAEYLGCNSNCVNVTGGSASVAGLKVQNENTGEGLQAVGYLLPAPGSWGTLGYTEDIDWSDWYAFAAVQSPFCFSVSKDSGFTTLDEVIEAAKANPGQMKWGNAGIGSAIHLSGQMLLDATGVDAVAVPFGGGREAATNVMAGEIDWVWASVGDVKDLLESGDLICLGSVSTEEIEITSPAGTYMVPSLHDLYPDAAANASALGYYGMALPRDTDPQAVAAFKEAFEYAVNSDEFKEFAEGLGMLPVCITGDEVDEMMAQAQSLYAWTLYEQDLAAEGITPDGLGIPKPADFDFSKVDLTNVNPWP